MSLAINKTLKIASIGGLLVGGIVAAVLMKFLRQRRTAAK
jgi:hypothetical protein